MKKIILASIATLAMVAPLLVSAHEHRMVMVGGKEYDFVVGFLNEPAVTGEKSGVDVRVMRGSVPVEGLEGTMKVEVNTGKEKRVLDLDPAWKNPGSYQAWFVPTLTETYSFHFIGAIASSSVDAAFSCSTSTFECPTDRATIEIPVKPSPSNPLPLSLSALALSAVAIAFSLRKRE